MAAVWNARCTVAGAEKREARGWAGRYKPCLEVCTLSTGQESNLIIFKKVLLESIHLGFYKKHKNLKELF